MTLIPHYSLPHALSLLPRDRLLNPEGAPCKSVPCYIIQILNLCFITKNNNISPLQYCVEFQVLTAVSRKNIFLLVLTQCTSKTIPTFRRRNIVSIFRVENKPSRKLAGSKWQAELLLDLFFDSENGGDMFCRNVGIFPTYTLLHYLTSCSLC